jgi:hypothetical protein
MGWKDLAWTTNTHATRAHDGIQVVPLHKNRIPRWEFLHLQDSRQIIGNLRGILGCSSRFALKSDWRLSSRCLSSLSKSR